MNLWEIKEEYLKVLDMTNDSEIDDQFIQDTLESLDFALEDKVDNYTRLIKQLEADCVTLDTYIKNAENKLQKKDKLIDYLKDRVKDTLSELNKDSIKTDLFDIKVVNNGGKQPMKVRCEDVTSEYITLKPTPNTDKIREDLEKGIKLPFAELLERGTHLSIK